MIKYYKKNPIVITAVQYNGTNLEEIYWFTCYNSKFKDEKLIIETLEGDMICDVNDYVICGIKSEFYPCKPDIFESSYLFVEDKDVGKAEIDCTNIQNQIRKHCTEPSNNIRSNLRIVEYSEGAFIVERYKDKTWNVLEGFKTHDDAQKFIENIVQCTLKPVLKVPKKYLRIKSGTGGWVNKVQICLNNIWYDLEHFIYSEHAEKFIEEISEVK